MATLLPSTRARQTFEAHGGVLRTSEALRLGVHPATLYAMRDAGETSASAGASTGCPAFPLSNPDLATVGLRVPQGVVCLISALYYHELTTEIPGTLTSRYAAAGRRPAWIAHRSASTGSQARRSAWGWRPTRSTSTQCASTAGKRPSRTASSLPQQARARHGSRSAEALPATRRQHRRADGGGGCLSSRRRDETLRRPFCERAHYQGPSRIGEPAAPQSSARTGACVSGSVPTLRDGAVPLPPVRVATR